MKNKKIKFLFIIFIVIGLICIGEINYQSLATDLASNINSELSVSLETIIFIIIWMVLNSICYFVALIAPYRNVSAPQPKKRILKFIGIRFLVVLAIAIFLFYYNSSFFIWFWAIDFVFLIISVIIAEPLSQLEFYTEMSDKKIKQILPYFDKEKFYIDIYQLYCEVQKAWMNFDYDKLRMLVTDELYNAYYIQMQILELKNEKNIISNFTQKKASIMDIKVENSIETIMVQLIVSFFDYTENEKGEVIRGNKDRKVETTYLLTFVRSHIDIESCPHCGAKLEDRKTVCDYCHCNILSVGQDMKLSKTEIFKQKWSDDYEKE